MFQPWYTMVKLLASPWWYLVVVLTQIFCCAGEGAVWNQGHSPGLLAWGVVLPCRCSHLAVFYYAQDALWNRVVSNHYSMTRNRSGGKWDDVLPNWFTDDNDWWSWWWWWWSMMMRWPAMRTKNEIENWESDEEGRVREQNEKIKNAWSTLFFPLMESSSSSRL